jgi:hypothetical protein
MGGTFTDLSRGSGSSSSTLPSIAGPYHLDSAPKTSTVVLFSGMRPFPTSRIDGNIEAENSDVSLMNAKSGFEG